MSANASISPIKYVLANSAHARIPFFNNEKGLKCKHFLLISLTCMPFAAIFKSLVIIFDGFTGVITVS